MLIRDIVSFFEGNLQRYELYDIYVEKFLL